MMKTLTKYLLPLAALTFCPSLPGQETSGSPIPIPDTVYNAQLPVQDPALHPGDAVFDGINWRFSGSAAHVLSAVTLREDDLPGPIPVGRDPGVLHFLQGASPGSGVGEIEGERKVPPHPPQVFGYELSYADGRNVTLHMDWRHHVAPMQSEWQEPALYSSTPVQINTNGLRLYHVRVSNPRPGVAIESIKMVMPEKGPLLVQPYLLAISAAPLETVELSGKTWAVTDFCALHGFEPLQADPEAGTLQVPMHGKSDRGAFGFHPEPVSGDFSVKMRIDDLPRTATWAFVGLTARDTLLFSGRGGSNQSVGVYFKPGDEQEVEKEGIFHVTAGKPVNGEVVVADGRPATKLKEADFDAKTPLWLRLVRQGDAFTGYSSPDGENWEEAGRVVLSSCPESFYIAIYTCLSHGPAMEYAQVSGIEIETN